MIYVEPGGISVPPGLFTGDRNMPRMNLEPADSATKLLYDKWYNDQGGVPTNINVCALCADGVKGEVFIVDKNGQAGTIIYMVFEPAGRYVLSGDVDHPTYGRLENLCEICKELLTEEDD